MAKDNNDLVVVAFFDTLGEANSAISKLQAWDDATLEIKLGAVGTIVKEDGMIKTYVGRKIGAGAVVGALVGIIASALSGGILLIGGLVVGGAMGGAVGAFLKNSTNLSKAEIDQIGNELDTGRVAVVVTCDDYEVAPTSERLVAAGGTVRNYTVPKAAMVEAAKAVPGADAAAIAAAPAEVVSAALNAEAGASAEAQSPSAAEMATPVDEKTEDHPQSA